MIVPEDLVNDQPDGTDQALPWTLESYMKINRKAYHCKPRFNVLRPTCRNM